jgi:two-component system sensor histidine kinase BarA
MDESIDITLALEQAAGNEPLAKELFGMLITELPELNGKLAQAITERNTTAMWDHAHKIYGATAYCGVPALRTAAKAMEAAIKTVDETRIAQHYVELNREIGQLVKIGPDWLTKTWI